MSLSLAPILMANSNCDKISYFRSLVGENVLIFSLICDVISVSVANYSTLILWL